MSRWKPTAARPQMPPMTTVRAKSHCRSLGWKRRCAWPSQSRKASLESPAWLLSRSPSRIVTPRGAEPRLPRQKV
ncbi:MAG TPA: hypothetical protein VLD85_06400 [Anaeromyxobacteraceae bacterium]|nr:hypothetical protein [Anaeromyxobacteraceae bacterium]